MSGWGKAWEERDAVRAEWHWPGRFALSLAMAARLSHAMTFTRPFPPLPRSQLMGANLGKQVRREKRPRSPLSRAWEWAGSAQAGAAWTLRR